MMMMTHATDPYATKVLFPEVHNRLVLGLKGYAEDAGIQPHWVWTPLADHVGEIECSYLKKFPGLRAEGQVNGLVLTRKTVEADPFEHMSALTGAFVRNFIRARLMTLQSVLQQLKDGDHIEATVLLIPNFFHSKEEGGSILQWQATHLYDLLLQRAAKGVHTVLYATSIVEMGAVYGTAFSRFVTQQYLQAEI
jgi:hypothetical protein